MFSHHQILDYLCGFCGNPLTEGEYYGVSKDSGDIKSLPN